MQIKIYQGIVEKGKIRLSEDIKLPEHATVYVLVADAPIKNEKTLRVATPRLARRQQSAEFKMLVSKE